MLMGYPMSNSNSLADPARSAAGGYYVPGGGSQNAYIQSLFLKMKPSVIVTDNIFLKSEWWLGDPVYGFFGSANTYKFEERQYNSTGSRGAAITAQRMWAEILTDVGTIRVGRAPLHWGLGVVWNSGDAIWDRYQSTGDQIGLSAKFGAFSVAPTIVKYSTGNNVGGACPNPASGYPCTSAPGGGGVSDYAMGFLYENADEQIDLGVNFVRRIAGGSQDTSYGLLDLNQGSVAGSVFNTWDLYGKKRFGRFSLAGEIPIVSGDVGGIPYRGYAFALETKLDVTDHFETGIKLGHAPGQPNLKDPLTLNPKPDSIRTFYFHPAYRLGLIMFNYQPRNFTGPNTLNNPNTDPSTTRSPFDNPITNAKYLSWGLGYKTGKWKFSGAFTYAMAQEAASKNSGSFFNTWDRRYRTNLATKDQSKSLGWEMDYGVLFHFDDSLVVGFDVGWWFVGDYYKFSNTLAENSTKPIFANTLKLGISF